MEEERGEAKAMMASQKSAETRTGEVTALTCRYKPRAPSERVAYGHDTPRYPSGGRLCWCHFAWFCKWLTALEIGRAHV